MQPALTYCMSQFLHAGDLFNFYSTASSPTTRAVEQVIKIHSYLTDRHQCHNMRDSDGVQVPRHCASLLFPWSTPQLSTAHQFGVVVRILASLTAFSMMLCALSVDACVPHQWRTCLSSQASSQLSSAD